MELRVTRRPVRKRKDGQPMCIIRGCRQARHDGSKLCAKHEADRRFSLEVRSAGECFAGGKDEHPCYGELQCAHILSRRYLALRWDLANALALCAAHHTYYTSYPEDWRPFLIAAGIDYDTLYDARYGPKMDPLDVLESGWAA